MQDHQRQQGGPETSIRGDSGMAVIRATANGSRRGPEVISSRGDRINKVVTCGTSSTTTKVCLRVKGNNPLEHNPILLLGKKKLAS
jgi:hypothetical protein